MQEQTRVPHVFIVYQNSERELADRILELYESWGCKPFHCRHDDMDNNEYRKTLRKNIRTSDLVVLLLSREFQWSPYCQAEAGTVMALEKPFIPIVVPPLDRSEIRDVAPVLEGLDYVSASDPNFVAKLREKTQNRLMLSSPALKQISQEFTAVAKKTLEPLKDCPHDLEQSHGESIAKAISGITDKYKLHQPQKRLSSTWSSLKDSRCVASIIGNIRKSLESSRERTTLTFVGISLKFSLGLITEALKSFCKTAAKRPRDKQLTIKLVHMDDQAHILHAMNVHDIGIIRDHFEKNWNSTVEVWGQYCKDAGIELMEPVRCRIDYLPPRVGVLIDDSVLYAGRCAFRPRGDSHAFDLLVGELEYLFYRRNEKVDPAVDPAANAIEEFVGFVKAYSDNKNNIGITPISNSDEWLLRIRHYLEASDKVKEVSFISATCTRFESMVVGLLNRKSSVNVNVFVHDEHAPAGHVESVKARIVKNLGRVPANINIQPYPHSATMRAVVIDDAIIGIQPYIRADERDGGLIQKMPLCLIITPCFKHFDAVKRSLLEFGQAQPMANLVHAG